MKKKNPSSYVLAIEERKVNKLSNEVFSIQEKIEKWAEADELPEVWDLLHKAAYYYTYEDSINDRPKGREFSEKEFAQLIEMYLLTGQHTLSSFFKEGRKNSKAPVESFPYPELHINVCKIFLSTNGWNHPELFPEQIKKRRDKNYHNESYTIEGKVQGEWLSSIKNHMQIAYRYELASFMVERAMEKVIEKHYDAVERNAEGYYEKCNSPLHTLAALKAVICDILKEEAVGLYIERKTLASNAVENCVRHTETLFEKALFGGISLKPSYDTLCSRSRKDSFFEKYKQKIREESRNLLLPHERKPLEHPRINNSNEIALHT